MSADCLDQRYQLSSFQQLLHSLVGHLPDVEWPQVEGLVQRWWPVEQPLGDLMVKHWALLQSMVENNLVQDKPAEFVVGLNQQEL